MLLQSLIVFFTLLPIISWAEPKNLNVRMQQDLDMMHNVLLTQYAPMDWKKIHHNWDLDIEVLQAKSAVQSNTSIKEYQRILKALFTSMEDYHAVISFYSTEEATLPFSLKSANGRYYLTRVDRSLWPEEASLVQAGDELVSFNGQPMQEAMLDFQSQEFTGNSLTESALSQMFFPLRLGRLGHLIPQGNVEIGIQHKGQADVSTYLLTWNYQSEKFASTAKSLLTAANNSSQHPFQKSMLSPWHKAFNATSDNNQSFIPTLGKKVWESDEYLFFNAYIFETAEKKQIGYIRIPDYLGSDAQVEEFRRLIKTMQRKTKALVIDQVNNPGGSMFYMYALASLLTDKPLKVPSHNVAITAKEVAEALDMITVLEFLTSDEEVQDFIGKTVDGNPISLKTANRLLVYFYEIIDAWDQGVTFTKPLPLWGIDQVESYPKVHYTKPILILINELDISCGDFFPAIMQDNKRATLFGTRTAGAGGFVLHTSFPNIFGIESFSYTGSIASRPDGMPIENLGVTPDIEYQIQEKDLTDNYSSYVKAVLDTLKKL